MAVTTAVRGSVHPLLGSNFVTLIPQTGQVACVCTSTATSTGVASSMLLWPIRFTSATPGLRISIVGGGTTTVNLAVTVGRNYWMSGDGQADSDGGVAGVGDVLRILQTALNTNPYGGVFTVSLTAAWRIQISIASGNFQILWGDGATDASLPGIFGYAANTAPVPANSSSTGTLLPQGIWRPQQPVNTDTREREPTVAGVAVTAGGYVRVASLVDHAKKERTISWLRVRQEYSLVEYQLAAEPTGSFEYAFLNSIKLGRPLRYYPDETSRTSTSYGLYRLASYAKDPLVRTNPSISNTRWAVGPLELRSVA